MKKQKPHIIVFPNTYSCACPQLRILKTELRRGVRIEKRSSTLADAAGWYVGWKRCKTRCVARMFVDLMSPKELSDVVAVDAWLSKQRVR
jgi:hypothetical protein